MQAQISPPFYPGEILISPSCRASCIYLESQPTRVLPGNLTHTNTAIQPLSTMTTILTIVPSFNLAMSRFCSDIGYLTGPRCAGQLRGHKTVQMGY